MNSTGDKTLFGGKVRETEHGTLVIEQDGVFIDRTLEQWTEWLADREGEEKAEPTLEVAITDGGGYGSQSKSVLISWSKGAKYPAVNATGIPTSELAATIAIESIRLMTARTAHKTEELNNAPASL